MAKFKTQHTAGHAPMNMSDAPTGPLKVALQGSDGVYATFAPEPIADPGGTAPYVYVDRTPYGVFTTTDPTLTARLTALVGTNLGGYTIATD